ncbi:MAG: hypothetical protein ISN29_12380 [Gammaproteobacteria bacterium AqS3]|nr:hypothetical protein [Gammaproteobacteria bacterium AqS3]
MPIAVILPAALIVSMLTADISILVLLLVPRPTLDSDSKRQRAGDPPPAQTDIYADIVYKLARFGLTARLK